MLCCMRRTKQVGREVEKVETLAEDLGISTNGDEPNYTVELHETETEEQEVQKEKVKSDDEALGAEDEGLGDDEKGSSSGNGVEIASERHGLQSDTTVVGGEQSKADVKDMGTKGKGHVNKDEALQQGIEDTHDECEQVNGGEADDKENRQINGDEEESAAAVKIQANLRGHLARKKLKGEGVNGEDGGSLQDEKQNDMAEERKTTKEQNIEEIKPKQEEDVKEKEKKKGGEIENDQEKKKMDDIKHEVKKTESTKENKEEEENEKKMEKKTEVSNTEEKKDDMDVRTVQGRDEAAGKDGARVLSAAETKETAVENKEGATEQSAEPETGPGKARAENN